MKNLCFLLGGKTFLKSLFPLIVFSNSVNIKPTILCLRKRKNKKYDNLENHKDFLLKAIKRFNVNCKLLWFDRQDDILAYMLKNRLKHLVCQDAQAHGRLFCKNKNIDVYSIGIFFDTLHYANEIRLNLVDNKNTPNIIYFPNKKFKNEFLRMTPVYDAKMKSLGSPLYDHALFVPKQNKTKKLVTFLVTLQRLVKEELQNDLEDFMEHCTNNNIDFCIKTKARTPWNIKNKKLLEKIPALDDEEAFPSSSAALIIISDLIISSYSTCAIESDYFGTPNINLESVSQENLTYAVNSIKYDYEFSDTFNSDICKTVSLNILKAYYTLIDKKKEPKEVLTFESNNSLRILEDIKAFL